MAVVVDDDRTIGTFFGRSGKAHLEMLDHALENDGIDRVRMMMKREFSVMYGVGAVMTGVEIVQGQKMPQPHMILPAM